MYKLRRMHLDTIGVPENRFAELTIDTVDATGNPTDTLIWMRNGSGKTTIMSLLAAHILPARRDFLAARKGRRRDKVTRTLEDLIQTGDTGHVVAEWEAPDGALLLTGAVWEWTNKRRPVDYSGANSAKLKHLFWTIRPDSLLDATFETLPLTSRTRGQVDLAGFHAWINARASNGVDAVAETSIDAWHRILDDRGFDAELYRYFVAINATEGGIDALFADIRTENDFARYLLGFVADAQRAASVRDLLRQVATELARRPAYRVEQEFCVDAEPRLAELARAHDRVQRSTRDRDTTAAAAAAFRLGLLDASTVAAERARRTADEYAETDTERRSIRQQADLARRRRDELSRLAAGFWLRDATVELGRAEEELMRTQTRVQSWEATERLLVLRRREAAVHAHRQAMKARHDAAEPLLRQVDQAAANYAAALADQIAVARDQLTALDELIGTQEETEQAARDRATAAERADAELATEAIQLQRRIQELTGKREHATQDGLLGVDEPIGSAATAAEQAVQDITADLTACDNELMAAGQASDDARGIVQGARQAREEAAEVAAASEATLVGMDRRAGPLNMSELAAALAQTAELDMLVDARRVAGLAADAAATADARLLERGVDSSTQRLAVRGLERDRLLPPRPAVRQVVAAILDAGGNAVPGWSYVAQHLPSTAALDAIRRLPEICDGIVYYGELPAGILDLAIDDPVVLASVEVFADLSAAAESWTVVGPSAARYDRTAGTAELASRRDSLTVHDRETAVVRTDRDAHVRLTAALAALADEIDGHGGAAALRETVARDAATLRERRDEEEAAEAAREAVAGKVQELTRRQGHLQGDLGQAKGRASRLRDLAHDLAELEPAGRRLAEVPALRAAEAVHRNTAAEAAEAARRAANGTRAARTNLATQIQRWEADEASVLVPSTLVGRTPIGGLGVAVQLWEQARRLAAEAFDEPELRRRLDDLVGEAEQAGKDWGSHDASVREQAKRFAGMPESQDPVLLTQRRQAASQDVITAAGQVSRAEADRDLARRAVDERRPTDRLRYADLTVEPTSRTEAEELAQTEDATAINLQERVGGLDSRLMHLDNRRGTEEGRARELTLRADRFADWSDETTVAMSIPTDPMTLTTMADRIYEAAREAASALHAAQGRRSQSFDTLRSWAADDRFARATDDSQMIQRLRSLFREQSVTVVAARSEALAEDLSQRKIRIDEHLARLDQSQQNVVTRLVDLVDDALADLARFSRLSELPAGIGPWQHREFVQVQPRGARPTDDQVRVRVTDLVDRLIEPGRSLDIEPIDLAWQATEAGVGPTGFRARILKPDPAQPIQKVDVTDMNKWSGGENLTACLVLFCVMVKLRAENRGKRAGSAVAGGLVPLDNPLGKANYVPFLQLQRTVAAASGVQLLFFTGIGDLPAVRAFDAIVACSKRRALTGTASFVTVDPEAGSTQAVERIRLVRRAAAPA